MPVLKEHNRLVRATIKEHHGEEIRSLGDGFLISFERASDAVRFAVALQRVLIACEWNKFLPDLDAMRVRIGMHTGEPITPEEADAPIDFWGPTANRAARVGSAGHGGQILVSHSTHILAAPELPIEVTFKDKGRHRLKGVGLEVLWQVDHPDLPVQFAPLNTESGVTYWNVPFERNPIFTGREDILTTLHEALQNGAAALGQAPAISGLGGIGKTQTAVEYAYRHRDEYDAVLWVGAESETTLNSTFAALATLLELPEKDATEQTAAIAAVHHWLVTHENWLLILDNADDLPMARKFVPNEVKGRILYTTRATAGLRFARLIPLHKLSPEIGAELLLKRAGLNSHPGALHWQDALQVSREMDGLPLALEQAGAFMEENAQSPRDYLEIYREEGVCLLEKHGTLGDDSHAPVMKTFSLAFQQMAKTNSAAADLLRLCAFLAPDNIPEEIFELGADELKGELGEEAQSKARWAELIGDICRRSLLTRDAEDNSLSIHRLVQAVLREEMNADERRRWDEYIIQVMNAAFLDVKFENWPLYERLLLHAQSVLEYAAQFEIESENVALLSNQVAFYLNERAQYDRAEPLYRRALAIREKILGLGHPFTAASLNSMASLYYNQGKWDEAEPLYKQALEIDEKVVGTNHPRTATDLNNLASLYYNQGKREKAEPLYKRALEIREKALGAEHPDTATSLSNLASLYEDQDKWNQFEFLYKRALEIREKALGTEHPDTATSLNNLAMFYRHQGKRDEARLLCEQALRIREKVLGSKHPATAISLNNLASLCEDEGNWDEARPLYERALIMRENLLGPEHPDTASALNNLAVLYKKQGKWERAEPLYERALVIFEKSLGEEHPRTVTIRNNYCLFQEQRRKQSDNLRKSQKPQKTILLFWILCLFAAMVFVWLIFRPVR